MTNKKVSNPLQTAYARRYTLTEGKETGLKVIELNNGSLRVLLNESKALDIMQVWYKGVNMSFVSKNGFTVRELAFAKRFEGGMLYTCGLDAVGDRPGLEPHGSLHNTPARVIRLSQDDDTLQVEALIEHTSLFGANLQFHRTVTLFVNDNKLLLQDTLVNAGTKPEDYCILYHVNFGYPMLDEGVEIVADVNSVTPVGDHAAANMHNRTVFRAPMDNEEECCYFLDNNTDYVSLLNRKLGNKVTLSYSRDTLPALVQWNAPASQDYALGIEPSTCYLADQFEYMQIMPGKEVPFYIQLQFEEL